MPPSECTNGPPTEKVAGRSHEGTAENQRAALIASRVAIAALRAVSRQSSSALA